MKNQHKIFVLLICEALTKAFIHSLNNENPEIIKVDSFYNPTWSKLIGKDYRKQIDHFIKHQSLFEYENSNILIKRDKLETLLLYVTDSRPKPYGFKFYKKLLQNTFPKVEHKNDLNDPLHPIWLYRGSIAFLHTFPSMYDAEEFTTLCWDIEHILENTFNIPRFMQSSFPQRFAESIVDFYESPGWSILSIFACCVDLVEYLELPKDSLPKIEGLEWDRVLALMLLDAINAKVISHRFN